MQIGELTAKDFASDQDLRWCPGCGDFAILKQVQTVLAKLGHSIEDTVFISGIGCSSRFPYYMNTYGMHSIHGRAAAIASGLRLTREDLNIWIVTGDGDSMSIGGNHLIHLLRRDLNVNLLLFNNEIYGLTKGQYSPTSKKDLITKSSPYGNQERAFDTLALCFGAGASFLARSIDREAKHLQEMLIQTNEHKGASFLEIYQNCHIFNDGTFQNYSDRSLQKKHALFLEEGKALIFGENQELAIKLDGLNPKIVLKEEHSLDELWIHDSSDKSKASILINQVDTQENFPKIFGVVYKKEKEYTNPILGNKLSESYLVDLLKGPNSWLI